MSELSFFDVEERLQKIEDTFRYPCTFEAPWYEKLDKSKFYDLMDKFDLLVEHLGLKYEDNGRFVKAKKK